MTKLITKEQAAQLLKNGVESQNSDGSLDRAPVVKLFTPDAQCTWLLSELDPCEPTQAFGLCDLGQGYPELGYVSLSELSSVHGPMGLHVERDNWFVATQPMCVYAEAARRAERIVEDDRHLVEAAAALAARGRA